MSLPPPGPSAEKSRNSSVSSGSKPPPARLSRPRVESRNSLSSRRKNNSKSDVSHPIKSRLHHLFEQIEKEFDVLINENGILKERVEALEEVILSPDFSSLAEGSSVAKGQSQQKLERLKRDSMSQISQKIKSTYKLKTSGKGGIFAGKSHHAHVRAELLGKYELHRDGVWYVTAAHRFNKLLIATASADGTASIFDLTSHAPLCTQIATYTGHQSCSVNCVKFHPKFDLLITASGDSGAHIWRPNFEQIFAQRSDPEDKDSPDEGQIIKQPIVELTGHSNVVIGCDWLSTVDQCVTAAWDRNANLYDLHTGELVMQLVGHDEELTDVAAHPSSPLVVTSSHDTTFRLWDFRESIHSVCVFQGHSERVNSAAFLGLDKVVSGSDDKTVKCWDLRNMRSPLANIHVESAINKLAVSQNLIAIPLENRNVRVYDGSGNRICRLPRSHHQRMVTCAAFAPPISNAPTSVSTLSAQLFTCSFDRKVCWWSLTSDKNEKSKD